MLQFLCRRKQCDECTRRSSCGEFDDSLWNGKTRSSKLLKLMVDERWDKVFQLLSKHPYNICADSSSRKDLDNVTSCKEGCEDVVDLMNVGTTGHTVLHLSCMFHPPVQFIEALLIAVPRAISRCNFEGQYPLHIAAHYGASPEVIGLLIDHFPAALRHQDMYSQSPLHKVCQSYADNYRVCNLGSFGNTAFGTTRKKADIQDAIQMITRGCPTVANLEDDHNCNALEYALASDDINLATIKCIQRACSRTWRKSLEEEKKNSIRRSRQSSPQILGENCSSHSDPGPSTAATSSTERIKCIKTAELHCSIRSSLTTSTCDLLDFHTHSFTSDDRTSTRKIISN